MPLHEPGPVSPEHDLPYQIQLSQVHPDGAVTVRSWHLGEDRARRLAFMLGTPDHTDTLTAEQIALLQETAESG